MLRNFALVLVGAAGAVALVLSCGNGGSQADAQAECDCPAAEPPLAGRIRMAESTMEIPASSQLGFSASCSMTGEIALGGRCVGDGIVIPIGVNLREAGLTDFEGTPSGWLCNWHNTTASPVPAKAVAYCLTPPSN